ncbi:MAG: hypothetical protein IME93_02170 [Proteobacteria bacterium]|nr:hypothetical protein [Pseudomonadota bacterium]
MTEDLFECAQRALMESQVESRLLLVLDLVHAWHGDDVGLDDLSRVCSVDEAGWPDRPRLVALSEVSRRGLGSDEGKAAFVHAITHSEAVNL